MRSGLLAIWLAVLTTSAIAAPPAQGKAKDGLAEEAIQGETVLGDGEAEAFTTFNNIKVPPMPDIEGDKFDDTVKDGYWYARSLDLRGKVC